MRYALGPKPCGRLTRQEIRGVKREKNFGKNGFGAGLAHFAAYHSRDVFAARINRIAETE